MSETIKLSDLQPDAHNANKGSERGTYMIRRSLEKLGAGRSIVLDKNGRIIAGNKTAEAAEDIGLDDVIVVRTDGRKLVAVMREDLDLDDPAGMARELAYADNRTGQVSLEWDAGVLSADIENGVDLSDWFTAFELDEFGVKTGDTEPSDAEPQIDRAEELREQWGVEPGQLWRLPSRTPGQEHRLICGDCTDAAVVERVMGGERADISFTSPPYNAGKTPTETKSGTERKYKDYSDDLTMGGYLDLLRRFTLLALKYSGYALVNIQMLAGNKVALLRYLAEFSGCLADIAIWDKQRAQPAMAENVMNSRFEFLLAIGQEGASRRMPGNFRGTVDNVYSGAPQTSNKLGVDIHAATMPLDFAAWVISNFCTGTILDPFLGSGTTIIAAENLSRQCRAVEISPAYVAVALQRYVDAFGIEPELMTDASH